MWNGNGSGMIYQPIVNVSLPVDRKRNNRYHRWMHSPLFRLNATIAVKFRRVVGVETPVAMFRRRRYGGLRLLGFTVARIHGDSGVVIAGDDGTKSAVVGADVQRSERRRRGWQLLLGGVVADGAATGWSFRRVTAAAWCWRLTKDTFPVTDVALGHRVQLVPGNPTGARPTHSNPRWSPPAMTPPLLRSPWLPLPTIPRTFRSLSVGAACSARLLGYSRFYDDRSAPLRSANAAKVTMTKGLTRMYRRHPRPRRRRSRRVAGTEPGTPPPPPACPASSCTRTSLLTTVSFTLDTLAHATHPIFWERLIRSKIRRKGKLPPLPLEE